MAKALLIEEFHLTVFVSSGLPEHAYQAIRRTLNGLRFQGNLRRAVRDVIGRYPSLRKVTMRLSR